LFTNDCVIMSKERRKDYTDIIVLMKEGAVNSTDIKHMKKTLDQHSKDIGDIKDTQVEIAADIKSILHTTNTRVKILEVKFRWIIGLIVAFFTGLGTVIAIFGKKIAAFLALTLP